MQSLPVKILSYGYYLPERVVTNEEVEALCHLEPGWIETKTGIRERHWVNRQETSAYMGAKAARQALERAHIDPESLDLILNASGSPPQALPDGGHLIQRELGLGMSGIPCMSVHTTCMSFLSGLDLAATYMAMGRKRNILIVTSDVSSRAIDFNQPESAVLLGDGAAAFVLTVTPEGESSGLICSEYKSFSAGADLTCVKGMGTTKHPNDPETTFQDNVFFMDGLGIAAMVRAHYPGFIHGILEQVPSGRKVSMVVPHQANAYALRALRRFGFTPEQVGVTLDRYGNCVAASIPLTLCDVLEKGQVKRDDILLFLGVGAGLCLGGALMVY